MRVSKPSIAAGAAELAPPVPRSSSPPAGPGSAVRRGALAARLLAGVAPAVLVLTWTPNARADGGAGGTNGNAQSINGGSITGDPGGPGGVGYAGQPGGAGSNGPVVAGTAQGGAGGGGGAAGGGNGGTGGNGFDGAAVEPGSAGGAAGTAALPNGQNGTDGVGTGGGGGGGGGFNGNGAGVATLNNPFGTTLTGGSGGAGGAGTNPNAGTGGGGAGGYGAIVAGASAGNVNAGTIQGGAGGERGQRTGGNPGLASQVGSGGQGGVGLQFAVPGAGLFNSGTIAGGNGTIGSLGGAGILGGDLAVVNSGTLSGGSYGITNGLRANAIIFTGGTNSLTLAPGYAVVGNARAFSTADTLALGGAGTGTFAADGIGAQDNGFGNGPQYDGFGVYQKTGTSTFTLTGTTAVTTPWQILSGTLAISADANLGATAGGVTIADDGTASALNRATLQTTATFSSARTFTLPGAAAISTDANTVLTLTGDVGNGGIGGVVKGGAGTLNLAGTSTYGGPTIITAGTLQAGADNALAAASDVTLFSGTTLDVNGYQVTIGSLGGASGTVRLPTNANGTSTLTIGGGLAGGGGGGFGGTLGVAGDSGNLVKIGAGEQFLAGTSQYTGFTLISAGTLSAGAANAFAPGSYHFVDSAGTLSLFAMFGGSYDQTIGSLGGAAGSTVRLGSATLTTGGDNTSTVFAGTLGSAGDTGGLAKVGLGTFTLAGTSGYGGPTSVGAGTLQAGANDALAANSAFTVANGAVLDLAGTANTIGSLAGAAGSRVGFAGGTLTAGGDGTATSFAGTLGQAGEAGNFVKAGAGTFTLAGTSGLTGTTYVSGGTLRAGAANAFSPGSFHFVESGATLDLAGLNQTIGSLGGNAGGAVALGAGTLTTGQDGNSTTYAGALGLAGDTGGLAKVGGGTFTLAGTSGYGGPTSVGAGTLQAGANDALAANSAFTVANGAVLNLAGTTNTVGSLAGAAGSRVGFAGGTLTAGGDGTATSFAGTLGQAGEAGNFVKAGAGTFTLSGTSGLTGTTYVSGGTLRAGAANAFSPGSFHFVESGATLDLAGLNQTIGSLGGNAGGAVALGAGTLTTGQDGNSTTYAGALGLAGDTGGLAKVGLGTFTLAGTSGYGGPTSVGAGTLQAGANDALAANSAFTVANGAVLDLAGTANTIGSLAGAAGSRVGFAGGTLTAGGDGTATSFAGTLGQAGEAGNFVKAGAGTFTLAGTSGLTGTTYVSGGTLRAGAANAFSPGSFHFVESGATLDLAGLNQTIGSLGGNAGGAVALGAGTLTTGQDGNSTTYAGALGLAGDTGGLAKVGLGTFTLAGTSGYGGPTSVGAGTLQAGANDALAANSAFTVANGAVLDLAGTANTIGSLAGAAGSRVGFAGGTLTAGGDGTATSFAGTLGQAGEAGNFVKAGAGTFTLAGTSGLTGTTYVSGGTLRAGAANAFSPGSFHFVESGATLDLAGLNQTIGSLGGNAGGAVALGAGTLTTGQDGNSTTYAGALGLAGDTGGLAKVGGGTFTLAGTSGYGGPTSVGAGTLQAGANDALAANSAFTVANGAVLNLAGTTNTVGSLAGAAGSRVGFAGGTLTAGGDGTATSFAGTLGQAGEAGNFVKAGAGTFTLSGTSGLTGTTYVSGGTLRAGAANAFSPGSFHFVESGATLDLAGLNQTIGSLGGNAGGTVALGAGTLTTGGDNTSSAFAGGISGAGALVKVGSGVFTLSGANTYSGTTSVADGALVLGAGGASGSILSDVTNNATLAVNRADTYRYDGVISGSGHFVQLGPGALVLTGDHTYTGGTTIAGGTLQLGDGGARGSILGDVSNAGTLAFNRSDAIVFPGTITGSGSVRQDGPGTTVLTGQSSYTGTTSVNAGTLTVEGSIVSPTLINTGGRLDGNGQVGGVTVASGGSLGSGNASTFGFLIAGGNVTFQPGSTYAVRIGAANQNDLVLALGSATLSGGTVRVTAVGSRSEFPSLTRYLILNAQNGLVGTFAGVSSNLAFLTPSLTYDRNNVFLDVGNPQFSLGATDGAGSAVATALQASFDEGVRGDLLTALQGLTDEQAGRALRSLSGQATSATQETSLQAGKLFMSTLTGQANSWIIGGGAADTNQVTLHETAPAYAALPAKDAAAEPQAAAAAPAEYARTRTWRAWGSGFTANTAIKDDTGSALNYRLQSSGGAIGADYQLSPNLLAGFAVGGTTSAFSVPQSLTSGSLEAAHIGVFGAVRFDHLYATAGLSLAHFDNSYRRTVADLGAPQTVRGQFGSDQVGGSVEFGYRQSLGAVTVAPFASVGFFDTVQQKYTEKGETFGRGSGSVALRFGQRTATSLPVTAGLQVDGRISLAQGWTWVPFARVAYTRDLQQRREIDASFADLPGSFFTVNGIHPTGTAASVKVGSKLLFNDTISAFAGLEGLFGERTRGYAAMGGLNVILGSDLRPVTATGATPDPYAASWTMSATPDFRFDSFSGDRGSPATSSNFRGRGSQIYSSVLLSAAGQISEDLSLSFSAKPGVVSSFQTTRGLKGDVSTVSDTVASATLTYLGVPGIQPFLSLSLNLPSGKPTLLGRKGNARLDPDFVEVAAFGEGLNIGPTLGVTIPVNEKFVVSTSVGYTHHDPYLKDGGIDPTTFVQSTSRYTPAQDYTASINLGYTDGPWSTQFSESFQHSTLAYVDGTPSYQLGNRFITSLTQGYAWNAATSTSVTATYIYGLRNRSLDSSLPAFASELENSNNSVLRVRADQPYTIDQWTIGPFGTFVFRDRNAYNASSGLFTPAKTLYSVGGSLKYAFTEKASITGSLEHFWARELARPAFSLPGISTEGWKTILTGTISF